MATKTQVKTAQDVMSELLSDKRKFIETLMMVENKSRELVPFTLNPIQSDMELKSTGRDLYVKPAQIGASTLFICKNLISCLTIPGTTSVIISYDEFITGRLLRKCQILYDNLKLRLKSIPEMHHKSTYEKTFVFKDTRGRRHGESSFFISSARSFSSVRGETIHHLLIDEFAFWQPTDAVKVFGAAIQRVPTIPGTDIVIVSTPNGEDNDFYEMFQAAKEGKAIGKSVFTAHFYRWFDHPEYQLEYDNPFVLPGDDTPEIKNLTEEEFKLIDNFGLTHDQIRWRRFKIAEMESLRRGGETRLLFNQEYPEDEVSCFLTAGDMVYDPAIINEKARQCYPAPIHEHFSDIWYPPEEKRKYLLSIDPGQGKISESVGQVWDFSNPEDWKHCATLCGYYDEKEMADKCQVLGTYFNKAIIAPEANLSIVPHLVNYPNLYYRTDPISGKVGKDIGWLTTPKTKPYMVKELMINLNKITTHDMRLVSQLRNIRWIGTDVKQHAGSVGAEDHHMAACIAIVCRDALPVERGFVGTKGWNW